MEESLDLKGEYERPLWFEGGGGMKGSLGYEGQLA